MRAIADVVNRAMEFGVPKIVLEKFEREVVDFTVIHSDDFLDARRWCGFYTKWHDFLHFLR